MTIHDILDFTTAELEKLTDDELKLYMAPMFIYTRPTSAVKLVEKVKKSSSGKVAGVGKPKSVSVKEQAMQLLREQGLIS